MYKKAIFFIVVVHLFLVCCANSKDFTLYRKGEVVPKIFAVNKNTWSAAKDFQQLFQKATGEKLEIISQKSNSLAPIVELSIEETEDFGLKIENEKLIIFGSSENDLLRGIRYLFSHYTNVNQFSINNPSLNPQREIILPDNISKAGEGFAYREPYFAQNFDPAFRLWNNTQTLEEVWGLWGHHIDKFITVTPQMMAIINGKVNDEQLDFSSPALQKALEKAIKEKSENDPMVKKFMIMPYDNDLVCQCDQCLALGNTKTNASPAVFHLINQLASKFPKLEFFSTAYVSTETPPKEALGPNVGIMLSSMPFPKGIVIENTKQAEKIKNTISNWKNITKNIYLWDYAINFDNYFEFYPTVSITQKNLIFYKSNGITGVFMHGSDEGSFVAFGDLKCYLYAQLLNKPDLDLKAQIRLFLEKKYPKLGKDLAEYYLKIEEKSLENNKSIDIYGGIKQSKNKYLKIDDLNKIINKINVSYKDLAPEEQVAINSILLSCIFQKLELLRTNGLGPEGYASFNPETSGSVLNPEITNLIKALKKLGAALKIETYNESGFTLSHYISLWETNLISKPYKNFFYQKPFQVLSRLDEDYSDISLLNDGALGFNDYYNNWLICTIDNLSIELNAEEVKSAKILQLHFLSDKKHKIYLPEKVIVSIGNEKFEVMVPKDQESLNSRRIVEVNMPITLPKLAQKIKIEVKKSQEFQKRAIACDEIIFK